VLIQYIHTRPKPPVNFVPPNCKAKGWAQARVGKAACSQKGNSIGRLVSWRYSVRKLGIARLFLTRFASRLAELIVFANRHGVIYFSILFCKFSSSRVPNVRDSTRDVNMIGCVARPITVRTQLELPRWQPPPWMLSCPSLLHALVSCRSILSFPYCSVLWSLIAPFLGSLAPFSWSPIALLPCYSVLSASCRSVSLSLYSLIALLPHCSVASLLCALVLLL